MYKCNISHNNSLLGRAVFKNEEVTTGQYIKMSMVEQSSFTRVTNSVDTEEDKKIIDEEIDNLFDVSSWSNHSNNDDNNYSNDNNSNDDRGSFDFGGGDGGGGGSSDDY